MKIEYGAWDHGMSNDAECENCDFEVNGEADPKATKAMREHLREHPDHVITHFRTLNRSVFVA